LKKQLSENKKREALDLAGLALLSQSPRKEAILIVQKNDLIHKKKPARFRPTLREGLRIQYCLKVVGKRFAAIGTGLKVSPQVVANVVFGRRHSARIEAEIARLLGKQGWDEVVLEARSEVQGKPIEDILREREAAYEARDNTVQEVQGEHRKSQLEDEEENKRFHEIYENIERNKQQRKQVRAGMRRFWNGSKQNI